MKFKLLLLFIAAPLFACMARAESCTTVSYFLKSDVKTKNTAGVVTNETTTWHAQCTSTDTGTNLIYSEFDASGSATGVQNCPPVITITGTNSSGQNYVTVTATSHSFNATGCSSSQTISKSYCTPYTCAAPPPPPPDPCCRCVMKGNEEYKGLAVQKAKAPCCTCDCPLIVDTSGNGFDLTSALSGVNFDIRGNGTPTQMAWTAPGAQNAFVCLPDSNGACDDGKDLFGNYTPQPPSQTPNGFLALAVYDLPGNGGNGDGIIDSRDAIFSRLRLWIDRNHDGISQPDEIYTLPTLGVYSISLNYKEDRKTDQYGNLFRYRAQVNPGGPPGSVSRMVYDVFLLLGSNTITAQSCPAVQPPLLPEKDGRLH